MPAFGQTLGHADVFCMNMPNMILYRIQTIIRIFHAGKVAGEVDPATTPQERIGLLMTGGNLAA